MTGNKSKRTRLASAPSFLDKSGGLYGRLDDDTELDNGDQPENTQSEATPGTGVAGTKSSGRLKTDQGMFHFNRGMVHDEGTTTLLRRKPSRWSRRSSRKAKADKSSSTTEKDNQESPTTDSHTPPICESSSDTQTEQVPAGGQESETPIVHFSIREEADDRALIWGQSCDREVEEEKEVKETQGQKIGDEQMKMAKRSTLKLYRKAIDRAFRRGWEAFVTSLYSVSLSPVSSAPVPQKAQQSGGSVLIDYR
ncbi:uncharacterized protein sb:cb1058 [Engraulis encrasicolus]|uniref:uncharacterized protein sb:cb1058 n=1 Tax=Engraulis encrasicolus TaxID=184585 RepID=UPI002FD0E5AA